MAKLSKPAPRPPPPPAPEAPPRPEPPPVSEAIPESAAEPTPDTESLASAAPIAGEQDAPPAVSAGVPEDASEIDLLPGYVAEVRARIEREKRYPAMARRRGEEGLVLARVAIAADGDLDSIDIDGEASVFLLRATREAVERARPFPMPPRGSVTIEIPVRWQVRR